MALKIRKGDTVMVMVGKDRGKKGRVQRVFPKEQRILVEGVNILKRHLRRRPGVRQAGIVALEAPIHWSKVRLVCPHCQKPVRVGFRTLEDGRKVRVCKKCSETIEISR
ncbi:MAG: 50S ribosomal protein L24 [Dehalococcoidia bacterium]|nr:50S ribosomal protein L24 [Dehalococcoidia bacterium]MDW8119300.1 50S ribosomal protein L24 [Chloroflexota bacterium]